MTIKYQNATFVANYLGVSTGSIHNWSTNPPAGFPEPDSVHYGEDNKITARGWLPERLPSMREWQAKRLGKEGADAEAHWLMVDAEMRKGRKNKRTQVPPGQIAIDIPQASATDLVRVEKVVSEAGVFDKFDDILIGTYGDDRIGDASFTLLGHLQGWSEEILEEIVEVDSKALEELVASGYARTDKRTDGAGDRLTVTLVEPVVKPTEEGSE